MGRLDRVVDPNNNVISYTYDRFGNRTQITGPHGTLKYTYDQLGRIETVTDQQGNVTRYTYDELGRQKKTSYANGTETIYTYDTLSRLTSVVNRKTTGEIITSHKYTLDAAGHRIKIEEAGSTVEYGYDKLNRLTSEKRNGVVTLDDGYTYDPVGNRLTKSSLGGNSSYTYDENDRLKSDGKHTYGWDENGNLTSRTGSEGTATYKYDPENRLIEVGGPSGTVQFAYDAQGNRISRTTSSGTTTFVVDPNMPYAQVLEESAPSGAKVYAYGNDMLNMQGPEGTRWFAYDGLGSTRALTDSTGTLTDAYTYEAFGTVVHRTGTSANDFQFTGEQYEAALDMYYLRARYYEPGTGRFGARDPWPWRDEMPQSHNKYVYAFCDPVSETDPSGLSPKIDWGKIIKLVKMPLWVIGTFVHYEIYDWYKNTMDAFAMCNLQVFKAFGVKDKPDIISVMESEGQVVIYEIKPDYDEEDSGLEQLESYEKLVEEHGVKGINTVVRGVDCYGTIPNARRLLGLVDIDFWQPQPGLVYYQIRPSIIGMCLLGGAALAGAVRKISLLMASSMSQLVGTQIPVASQMAAMGVY